MIHAPPFHGNVYIGTPWVLFHLGVVAVNNGPVVLPFVLVPAISSHWVGCGSRMFCCVLRCLVDYLCVVLAWFSVYVLLYVL